MGLWMSDVVPFAAMVIVECVNVGISTISKAAMNGGLNNFVLVVYSDALGTLLLFPFFIFNRNKRLPITFRQLCKFFFLGLIGVWGEILHPLGVKYSSPTLSSAMGNLSQIFTFLLAIIFRMEKLDLTSSSCQAKSLGTIVSVLGALTVTLYKGPGLFALSPSNSPHQRRLLSQQLEWAIGGGLLAITFLISAIWNIAQTAIVKAFPDELTVIFFYNLFVTIQSMIFTLAVESNPAAWKLKSGIDVTAVLCSGIFGSVIRLGVHTWCLHKKGPVYVVMFRPLGILFAVIMGIIFLGETLHLGSVIGSLIIAFGFYTVMWGQIKEKELAMDDGIDSLESASQRSPLVKSDSNEET
ncbi:WAT1-related protein At5g40240-like isoform X1 [Ziziphus jujuba]|uniref:WAT1-related protein n=1 Tax=Ziziphus jujuba TaxID=326968 RepID=A0A6P3ZKJ8_ZIZJJ|nr:WAT1-related protein At5g40240-like isoform X1 [Ziziphus jujuba]